MYYKAIGGLKMTCWILSWCDGGLESVVNLTEINEQFVFDNLAEKTKINPIPRLIDKFELRARFNQHRNYEVYTIHIADDMNEEDIRFYFEENSTEFKNLIRQKAFKTIFA